MITLRTRDKCENCPSFQVEQKTIKNEDYISHELSCANKKTCEHLLKYLEEVIAGNE